MESSSGDELDLEGSKKSVPAVRSVGVIGQWHQQREDVPGGSCTLRSGAGKGSTTLNSRAGASNGEAGMRQLNSPAIKVRWKDKSQRERAIALL
jgi:hypothetical protein